MISTDIKANVKQEIKVLVAVFLKEVPSKPWNTNAKRVCIFHLVLDGIPSSLILPIKKRGFGCQFFFVICQWSLGLCATYIFYLTVNNELNE